MRGRKSGGRSDVANNDKENQLMDVDGDNGMDFEEANDFEEEEGRQFSGRVIKWHLINDLIHGFFSNLAGSYRVGDIYIPPPVKPYCSNESHGSRLIITNILNRDFKSYAGEVALGPFTPVSMRLTEFGQASGWLGYQMRISLKIWLFSLRDFMP